MSGNQLAWCAWSVAVMMIAPACQTAHENNGGTGYSGPPGQTDIPQGTIRVNEDGTFTIRLEDVDVRDALDMFCNRAAKNCVLPGKVHGRVTVQIENAAFDEALDAILRPLGYGFAADENWIWLLTAEEADLTRQMAKTADLATE